MIILDIDYISDWVVSSLNIQVPLVLSSDVFYLVSIRDLFMLSVFLGIFIIFIKYLITDNIDIHIGDSDINYSSSNYLNRRIHNDSSKLHNKISSIKNTKSNISNIKDKKSKIYMDSVKRRVLKNDNVK